ncbi:MAG: SUMF1/EgtB/PvdO family nonheme iron enzyme, partial [Acidobacteria bacterium]|nr:SUMF1/EgtB/PvdO family nonheme iron enzyme [Acidobacteriota bacterium]
PQPPATPLPDRGVTPTPGQTGSRPPVTGTAAPTPPRPSGAYPQNVQPQAPWQPPQGPHQGMTPPAAHPTQSRRSGPPSAEHPAPPTAERPGTGRPTAPPTAGAPAPDSRKTGPPPTGTQLRPTGSGPSGGTRPGTGPLQPKTGPRTTPGQAFQAQAAPPKSKLPLILGAAGLVVVVVVLILLFATGKSPEPTPGPEKPASPETPGPEKTASFTEQMGMKFVKVAAGKFKMGSDTGKDDEKPAHDVTISRDLFVSTTEVTEKQWRTVLGEGPATARGDEYPVEVSWEDAQRFLKALGEKTGKTFRLPTEAEWEYACRAGESGDYYWGGAFSPDHCWFNGNSGGKPQPVGGRKPNAWGLFDMAGNVYEWCQDWKSDDFYAKSPPADPKGPDSGEYRILRGGSWDSAEDECRSAYRAFMKPTVAGAGFRVVTNDPVP